jgi:hypothetical protein
MKTDLFRLAVQTVISLGLLASGVFVLVTTDWNTNPEISIAAAGWVGLVAGYWLK